MRSRRSPPPASTSRGSRPDEPRALILDVHMNVMTGLELQQRLTAPVIFITSHDDAWTRARIEKSGAVGHLWKPFDDDAVLDAIRRAVGAASEPTGPPAALA